MINKENTKDTKKKQRGDFLKNVATLSSASLISQVITVGLMPVITRLFSPNAYGFFNLFFSLVKIIAPISSLRYTSAILLPKDDKDADSAAILSVICSIITSLVLLAVIAIWGKEIASLLGVPEYSKFFFLVPFGVLITSNRGIMAFCNLREKKYKKIGAAKICRSAGNRAGAIYLGLRGYIGSEGLIWSWLAGQCIELGINMGTSNWKLFSIKNFPGFRKLVEIAKRYKHFPMYSISSFIGPLTREIPVLMLSGFFAPAIVGYYGLCNRILLQPMTILGEALSYTFFEKSSKQHREGEGLTNSSTRLYYTLVNLVLFPVFLFVLSAQEIFVFVFGSKWEQAGAYFLPLALVAIMNFISRPLDVLFDVLEKQKELLIFGCILLVVNVITLVIGGSFYSAIWCIFIFAAGDSLIRLIRTIWIMAAVGVNITETLNIFCSAFARAVIFILPLVAIKYYLNLPLAPLLLCSIISLAAYVIYILRINKVTSSHFMAIIGKNN